jgi:hypothetical protein
MKKRVIFSAMILIGWFVVPGCIGNRPANPATTRPVTWVDPNTATPEYWWGQPASVSVPGGNFNTLWDACERVARDWLFKIEMQDFRHGILATEPMVSKQVWEFWRKDAGTFTDTREATMDTIRRTIRFQFTREADGSYSMTPKVLVERKSIVDPKYRIEMYETPAEYWYAIRRDTPMELKLAEAVRGRLTRTAGKAPPG